MFGRAGFRITEYTKCVAKDDGKIMLTDRNIHAYLTSGWSESVNMPLRAFRTLFPNG